MDEKKTLKELLLYKDVTQTELAKLAGYKRQTNISSLLNSNSRINIELFTKLVNLLNADVIVKDRDSERTWKIEFNN